MATPSAANRYIRQVVHRPEPPPPARARFFYTSPIPIDDPLSPLPPPSTGTTAARQPPKPFSAYDNAALDDAWHALRRQILRYNEERGEKSQSTEPSRTRAGSTLGSVGRGGSGSRPTTPRTKPVRNPAAASSLGQVDGPSVSLTGSIDALDGPSLDPPDLPPSHEHSSTTTTGTPFVRAPSRKKVSPLLSRDERPARPKARTQDTYEWEDSSHLADSNPAPPLAEGTDSGGSPTAEVAVGISRLHQVEMPALQMTPIYWAPVHDDAVVVRATWFYQDTMLPVETSVAVMLEAGYVDLQCWTETWADELNSAVDAGARGEEKIVHKLWPDAAPKSARSRSTSVAASFSGGDGASLRTPTANMAVEPETPEQVRERTLEAAGDLIDISTGPGGADNKASGTSTYGREGVLRTFESFGVIYANATEARLLKPSLMPSAYFGRRPLAHYIRKGHKLGIPVVRGFDQTVWDRLHPPKTGTQTAKAERGTATSDSGAPPKTRSRKDPDLAKADRPQVTDLVLVIHGIGQKLSQRMESFHFTHAINAFRREINVEVGSKEIKALFRKDMGGIMALPVNWRHLLSFEEGGYRDGPGNPGVNEFTLGDITPQTLPAVRNIVSDVMLDIPYYMSDYQPRMIAAVVREANRVYQLWCRNNPGFAQNGRVHIIAHSLGSVMAVDILSRQPTTVPASLSDPTAIDLDSEPLDHFIFNTSNLFLAGSPAGFFLLLKKAQLLPRIDHPSLAAQEDPSSNNLVVCGERGQYGCVAVDNLYNIINPYDPVAYRMNAAVDAAVAASLKQATIPSATPGWFGVGTKSSYVFGGGGGRGGATAAASPRLPRLPSRVELETHNFTREEIAEKRMLLLNDNGQIDFFLRYGGGAFDIQYITMLGAHSSYWLLRDFVRIIVTECGREKGRDGTFLGLRAVKKKRPVGAAGMG